MTEEQKTTSESPTPSESKTSGPKKDFSWDLDDRTKKTMIWSAAFYAVAKGIENIASQSSYRFYGGFTGDVMRMARAYGAQTFNFNYFLSAIIWGAVGGAAFGFILSKFYPKIQELNKKYLKSKLDTMFKLLFYPTLLGAVLYLIFGGALSFVVGFMPVLLVFGGAIVGNFLYAKLLSAKIEKDYPPMV